MADTAKLQADVETLAAKLDAFIAAQVPPAPPVDDQPAIDAVAARVEEMIAKLP